MTRQTTLELTIAIDTSLEIPDCNGKRVRFLVGVKSARDGTALTRLAPEEIEKAGLSLWETHLKENQQATLKDMSPLTIQIGKRKIPTYAMFIHDKSTPPRSFM